jgi:hypothetical protein
MKLRHFAIILLITLSACAPKKTLLAPAEVAAIPTYTPPPGTARYDGCAFRLDYPQDLEIDGSGWYLVLGEEGQVFISAEKAGEISPDASLEAWMDDLGIERSQATISSVTVVDSLGQELSGLQADDEVEGDHFRIWVIMRPETLLGDMSPEDVIYQIRVQTPIEEWNSWQVIVDLIFESFVPMDCGGL